MHFFTGDGGVRGVLEDHRGYNSSGRDERSSYLGTSRALVIFRVVLFEELLLMVDRSWIDGLLIRFCLLT